MALPAKLKNFNAFIDGQSYLGLVNELTPPPLNRKMEPYRGGGMSGEVEIDFGPDGPIELEWKCGGFVRDALRQYGATRHDAVQLRIAGAYQRDDTSGILAIEFVLRGRHKEIGFGTVKAGDDTETTFKTTCSYYKIIVNGVTDIELDFMNMIEIVGGVDRLAQQRAAIGY